jgi:hypothetical protein
MNSQQGRSSAESFANKLHGKSEAIVAGYRLALGREPSAEERRLAEEFLKNQSSGYRASGRADADKVALTDLCQALFSMNEFVYVD